MGLFDFLKKNKKEETAAETQEDIRQEEYAEEEVAAGSENKAEDKVTEPESEDWKAAKNAEPKIYEKDGETVLFVTLSVGTDTILPMDPDRMFKAEGKEISDFRLFLVESDQNTLISDLPFYSSIHALSGHVLEIREPNVLIKGLSSEALRAIADEVENDIKSKEIADDKFKKNLEFIAVGKVTPEEVKTVFEGEGVRRVTFDHVKFSSGKIIAADPICYLQSEKHATYLEREIQPGVYPMTIGVFNSEEFGIRMTGIKLEISDRIPVSYEAAADYVMVNGEKKPGAGGFGVDAGMATFCDADTAKAYWEFLSKWYTENPEGNFYDDYLAELFQKSYEKFPDLQREGGDFIRWRIPGSEQEMIMVASGLGDGFYCSYWGFDSYGNMAELVTMFLNPEIMK